MPVYEYESGTRVLDGYTIQYALGRGGFGEVYYAVSDSGREVALKAIQQYEEVELRGLSQCMNLKSPHLVMIFDVRRDEQGSLWAIMEYITGPSLRELIDRSDGGLPGEQVAFLVREIARGLRDLHEAGIVHRDLKPENIFIENGVVKIGDYSLSKTLGVTAASNHTTTIGSVHYMAPEISEGKYDSTIDIYALGAIMHEMLTGKPPHSGESVGEVLMKHLRGQLSLDGIPHRFAGVIQKAMNRDPNLRYMKATDLADDLLRDPELQDLANSIRPRSLSMVGDRRVNPARRPRHSYHPANEDTAAKSEAMRDTDGRLSEPVAEDRDEESLFFGLSPRWQKAFVAGIFKPSTLISLPGVFLVNFAAIGMSTNFGRSDMRGEGALASALFITLAMLVVAKAYKASMSGRLYQVFSHRRTGPLTRRLIMPGLIAVLITLLAIGDFAHGRDFDRIMSPLVGILISSVIIDWFARTHPLRRQRFDLPSILWTGAICGFLGLVFTGDMDWVCSNAVIGMASLASLQWFSPMGAIDKSRDQAVSGAMS